MPAAFREATVGRLIPLEAFENCPLLLTDQHGCLVQCNESADSLFEGRLSSCLGRPCWEAAGFRTPGGSPFCGVACPVQRAARAGEIDLVVPRGRQAQRVTPRALLAYKQIRDVKRGSRPDPAFWRLLEQVQRRERAVKERRNRGGAGR